MLLSILASLTATAAPLVLHEASVGPALAVRGVARIAEVDEQDLAVSTLPSLLADAAPLLAGDGELRPCTGEPTSHEALGVAIDEAAGALDYAEYAQARAVLDTALASLPCLFEPLQPELVARAWYLHGMAWLGEGDKPKAWSDFGRTWHYDQGLDWDDTYPPDGKATFEAARAEQAATDTTRLEVLPPGTLVVNGETVRAAEVLDLRPGRHVLQTPESYTTALLDLPPGAEAELLLPWELDDRSLTSVATSDTQALLAWALSGRGHDTVYVYLPDRPLWTLDTTTGTWTPLSVAISEVPPPVYSVRNTVRSASFATTGAGLLLTGVALWRGSVAAERGNAATDDVSYNAAARAHERWFYTYLGGLGVTGAGVLGFSASFVLPE